MEEKDLLDLKESKLLLEGTSKEQKVWSKRIGDLANDLEQDRGERKNSYIKRKDFYTGNHGSYSNVTGIVKDTKQKKGHTNQVTNYAGRTTVKIAMGLANNPPKLSTVPLDVTDDLEVVKTQAVEDFIDSVLTSKKNRFWKKTYRRAAFHQSEYGDAAIKTYIEKDSKTQELEICIKGHDDLSTLSVGWNGEPGEYGFVIAEVYLSPSLVYDMYGIKVNEKALKQNTKDDNKTFGSWENNNQWATKGGKSATTSSPSGKTQLPKVKVQEYDSDSVYALKIEGELVSLVFKDGKEFPDMGFWTMVHNIPNPPSPWSIADIDYLMDPQIELNENDNRSSDHLRVGNVQRYVAYNMNDFDPESIKTSSGQVIFVNDPDGKARFEPLQTNINNFPDDQYHNRKMNQIYDMGLPKVNFGSSGADSGRSKALDYQSSIDLTNFKRDAWELALQDICEKIQVFGNFIYGDKVDWFTDSEGNFVVREIEFDWTDMLPVSASDKIVNIANKVNMIGISLKTALKELGYRNPDAEIAQLKKELAEPDLMILRSKMWNFSQGILQAQAQASMMAQSNVSESNPNPQSTPTLTSEQNSGAKPMASAGTTTSYSSAQGELAKTTQNNQARGG